MIIVCEPIVNDQEHVPVNSAFLAAIRLAFPQQGIKFLAEKKHLHFVEEQLETLNLPEIDYVPISPPARHSSLSRRMLADYQIVRRVSRMANAADRSRIVFLSIDHNHLAALALRIRTGLSNTSVQVVLHGGLADVAEHRRNPIARALNLRQFLRVATHRNIQFLVLENWIFRNLQKLLPSVAANTAVVPHPLPVHESPSELPGLKLPIRVGFLGLATPQKGFDRFLQLAADRRWESGKRATFELIGRLPPNIDHSAAVAALGRNDFHERLSRSEYVTRLAQCHLVYVDLDTRYYAYSASGVLLDTVAWRKPILCGGPLLREFFADYAEPVGYFCQSENVTDKLEHVAAQLDRTGYSARVRNLQTIANLRTIYETAATIRKLGGPQTSHLS